MMSSAWKWSIYTEQKTTDPEWNRVMREVEGAGIGEDPVDVLQTRTANGIRGCIGSAIKGNNITREFRDLLLRSITDELTDSTCIWVYKMMTHLRPQSINYLNEYDDVVLRRLIRLMDRLTRVFAKLHHLRVRR